jgi:hypothetical protein
VRRDLERAELERREVERPAVVLRVVVRREVDRPPVVRRVPVPRPRAADAVRLAPFWTSLWSLRPSFPLSLRACRRDFDKFE